MPLRDFQQSVKPFPSAVDALQNGRCKQELEGAAHRKPLIRPIPRSLTGAGIEDRDPETPAIDALNAREGGSQAPETSRSSWQNRRQSGRRESSGETPATKHRFSKARQIGD